MPVESPPTNSPISMSATAPSDRHQRDAGCRSARSATAAAARPRASPPCGGTRVARSAGRSAGEHRDSDADDQRDDDRARLKHGARLRQVGAEGDEQRVQRRRSTRPRNRPDDRREHAEQQRLRDHRAQDLAARGAERAQRRQFARALGDRDRERVEDDERADEQRDVGEDEQESPGSREEAVGVLRRLLASAGAGAHLRARRQHRADLARAAAPGVHAGRGGDAIVSSAPPCRTPAGRSGESAAPSSRHREEAPPNFDDARRSGSAARRRARSRRSVWPTA